MASNVEVIRSYRSYSSIGRRTRARIQSRLGKRGGMMREVAARKEPICVVAFRNGEPVGWCALFRGGCKYWRGKTPAVQVFVDRRFRRRGIGRRLVERLLDRERLWDGPTVNIWQESAGAKRFYKGIGFTI